MARNTNVTPRALLPGGSGVATAQRLHVVYIRPSRYDDDGYVVRHLRGLAPSNTLSCLESLTRCVAESGQLGGNTRLTVDCYDESVQRIPVRRIAGLNRQPGTRVVVGLAGAQTCQFARASDLALELRAEGIQVMIGGFHVSGTLALSDAPPPELQRLLEAGVTLVRGEAEAAGALVEILRDAARGTLRPIYRIPEFPDLLDAPVPRVNDKMLRKTALKDLSTIDISRGCPFNCSFCSVINVQGRKMRHRSAACVIKTIEEEYARGITLWFFTDDNFCRNPVWEDILDGLIELRRRGIQITFLMQVDAMAHRIPRFAEKAAEAGCILVFIGIESLNPENIKAIGKDHNRISEYAEGVKAWHNRQVLVHASYLIGLPFDTMESLRRDIQILRDELQVELLTICIYTPVPGSQDHLRFVIECVPIDADLNNYDAMHETFRHARMRPGERVAAYHAGMRAFYSRTHMVNTLRRMSNRMYLHMFALFARHRLATLQGVHPMSESLFRLKDRRTRRPIFPREGPLTYAWRRTKDSVRAFTLATHLIAEFLIIWVLTWKRGT